MLYIIVIENIFILDSDKYIDFTMILFYFYSIFESLKFKVLSGFFKSIKQIRS